MRVYISKEKGRKDVQSEDKGMIYSRNLQNQT
jgi:hypothetical protein